MTNYKPITEKLLETIDKDLVRGYRDEEGKKVYPTVKEAANYYKVSYNTLRRKVGKLNWEQRRKDYVAKVRTKVAEKKQRNDEEISEAEAEAIVVEDYHFNEAANKLRRAAVKEIDKLLDEDVVLFVTKEGEVVKGTPKNAGYHLMNLGKALESAQKISKTAAGEPAEINETRNSGHVEVEGRYAITKRIICSPPHIEHELDVLNAANKAQGCNK
jgi:DNA-binding transcriptional regulator YhcF (GntR family)